MIYSKKLLKFKEITHGFTTREEGDMRKLKTNPGEMVLANQVHGNNVVLVMKKDKGELINKTDGLITLEKEMGLGIRTADCCPIIFYEPVKGIIAGVHAGWKGTQEKIVTKAVLAIEKIGGKAKNIIVVIGPHICQNCYEVLKDRAQLFSQDTVVKKGSRFFLDLGLANFKQLLEAGVLEKNIERLPYCTFHQNDLFYSYRKNSKDDYGEMLSFIEIKSSKMLRSLMQFFPVQTAFVPQKLINSPHLAVRDEFKL